MSSTRLFGLEILNVKKDELLQYLDNLFDYHQSFKTQLIATPNPEQIVLAQHDQGFASHLKQMTWLLPDGVGLVWASAILEFFGKTITEIEERIAGVDVVEHLLQQHVFQSKKHRALIIGGRDYSVFDHSQVSANLKNLKELQPNLFWMEGYQDKTDISPIEEQALVKTINRLQPSMVFVALGAPDQEKWLIKHRSLLENNQVKIAMAVGGSFDFLFAKVPRAPKLWQKIGLEWLWRLIKQPWRSKRQLRLFEFIYLLIKEIV
jgi:N-acetylglucosaminyldiphosphoundecaprenol N-acetyl-beta-D-mannosaminyltransferase